MKSAAFLKALLDGGQMHDRCRGTGDLRSPPQVQIKHRYTACSSDAQTIEARMLAWPTRGLFVNEAYRGRFARATAGSTIQSCCVIIFDIYFDLRLCLMQQMAFEIMRAREQRSFFFEWRQSNLECVVQAAMADPLGQGVLGIATSLKSLVEAVSEGDRLTDRVAVVHGTIYGDLRCHPIVVRHLALPRITDMSCPFRSPRPTT
ncbi:hypothetical protein [Bradyrhizobium sp. JR3.5]